jgi:hypothetical protein
LLGDCRSLFSFFFQQPDFCLLEREVAAEAHAAHSCFAVGGTYLYTPASVSMRRQSTPSAAAALAAAAASSAII